MSPGDWVIMLGILAIATADIVLIMVKTPTISRRFRDIASDISMLPYAWGALAGHFWGPSGGAWLDNWWASIGLLLSVGVLLSIGHRIARKWLNIPGWFALIYLPCGALLGAILWPQ